MIWLSKLLLAITIICIETKAYTVIKSNLTHELTLNTEGSRFYPVAVKVKDQLIYISFPQTEVGTIMKLESLLMNGEPCEIPLSGMVKYRGKPIALGNGKIIMGMTEAETETSVKIRFYIIDKDTCSYNNTELPGLTIDFKIPQDNNVNLVPNEDTFELFLSHNRLCDSGFVCRLTYDDFGTLLMINKTNLQSTPNRRTVIVPVEENNSSMGYFAITYRENDRNDFYLYMRLHPDMNVTGETIFIDGKNCFSTAEGWRTVCQVDSGPQNTMACMIHFQDRQLLRTYTILPAGSHEDTYYLQNVPDGGVVILSVSKADSEVRSTYVQYIDKKGEFKKRIKFFNDIIGPVEDIQFFKMKNGLCVTMSSINKIVTKCIAPAKKSMHL